MKSAEPTAQSAEHGKVETSINTGRLSSVVSSADCRSVEQSQGEETRNTEQKWETGRQASPLSPSESVELEQYRERQRKNIARRRLLHAVRSGRVRRPDECSRCKAPTIPDAHHVNGYDDPLDVVWVCRVCHGFIHHPNSDRARLNAYLYDPDREVRFQAWLQLPAHLFPEFEEKAS